MWTFQDFSSPQILREIKLRHSKSLNIAILAILEVMEFDFFYNFSLLKVLKFTKKQNLEPLKLSKMAVFEFLNSLKLFSRKICMAQKNHKVGNTVIK